MKKSTQGIPKDRKIAVSSCDLDNDAILLRRREVEELLKENGKIVEKRYILFTPFPVRLFRFLAPLLGSFPLGAQYYVAAKK